MTRTFIALELNSALQHHLACVIRQMAEALPSVRWVDPISIHLTLAFLGELDDEELEAAKDATRAAVDRCKSFEYGLSRLNIFGPVQQPRVIWMAVAKEQVGIVQGMHRVLSEELVGRGFTLEMRPFAPHFTLARPKAPLSVEEQRVLRSFLVGKHDGIATGEQFRAEELVVMRSELLAGRSRYSVVEGFRLL